MGKFKPIFDSLSEAALRGARHADARLPQLARNHSDQLDDWVKRIRGEDRFDGKPDTPTRPDAHTPAGPPRVDVTVRRFTRNPDHDSDEFRRQLDEQMDALRNMPLSQWIRNRDAYLDAGRTSDSLRAQQAARDSALEDRIAELIEEGRSFEEATELAGQWLRTQAATHRLDGIAGGDVTDISGVGDARVNSSLGSQWRSRVDDIQAAVDAYVVANPGADLDDVRLNVLFR